MMPSLKEILPLIMAGAAGAGSPQGADVFQNILSMKEHQMDRKEQKEDRANALQDRLTVLELQEAREERAVAGAKRDDEKWKLDKKRQEGVARQSEITLRNMQRKELEDTGMDPRSIAFRETLVEQSPDMAWLYEGQNYEEMEALRDTANLPSTAEQIAEIRSMQRQGVSGTLEIEGGSVSTGRSASTKAKTPLSEADARAMVADNKGTQHKLERELRDARSDLAEMKNDTVMDHTASDIAKAESAIEFYERELENHAGKSKRDLLSAGVKPDYIEELLGPGEDEISDDDAAMAEQNKITLDEIAVVKNHIKRNPGMNPQSMERIQLRLENLEASLAGQN